MQSVGTQVNAESSLYREFSYLEWNDDKQLKLETYIDSHRPRSGDYDIYDYIDWKYLKVYLKVNEIEYLQLKVDEIYDKHYNPIEIDKDGHIDLERTAQKLSISNTKLQEEARLIIEELNLKQFKKEPSHEADIIIENKESDKKIRETRLDSNSSLKVEAEVTQIPIVSEILPTQKDSPRERQGSNGYKLESKFNRTAPTLSINNINVVTKAEVGPMKVPVKTEERKKPQIKNKLRNVSQKLKESIKGNKANSSTKTQKAVASYSNDRNSHLSVIPDIEATTINRSARRRSMVVDTLPIYIKEQLQTSPKTDREEQSTEISSSKKAPADSIGIGSKSKNSKLEREKSKLSYSNLTSNNKHSRLKNLLNNSSYMYAHSKDISNIKPAISESQTHTSTTSGYGSDRMLENGSDEEDKVYISPNSLTKFYEREDDTNDEEAILKGIEDDEVDFVNLNDSFEDSINENDENDDQENGENYLFKF